MACVKYLSDLIELLKKGGIMAINVTMVDRHGVSDKRASIGVSSLQRANVAKNEPSNLVVTTVSGDKVSISNTARQLFEAQTQDKPRNWPSRTDLLSSWQNRKPVNSTVDKLALQVAKLEDRLSELQAMDLSPELKEAVTAPIRREVAALRKQMDLEKSELALEKSGNFPIEEMTQTA